MIDIVLEKSYIEDLPMWASKKNSLADVREYLRIMGLWQFPKKIIHVAGTNGKGSVCAYISSILKEAGFRVGTFISPHLVEVNERVLLDMMPIDDTTFAKAAHYVRSHTKQAMESGLSHPTYFEYLFYMAIYVYMQNKVDYIVLETGLGGRLDVTNVFNTVELSVITSIGLDHCQYLGNTTKEIAAEKAGIIKEGGQVVVGNLLPSVYAVIEEIARKKHAHIYALPVDIGDDFSFLPAPYQIENARLAAFVVHLLRKDLEKYVKASIYQCIFHGRMEEVRENVFLDGAHNVDGIDALIQAILFLSRTRKKKIKLVLSCVEDKDFETMSKHICGALEVESYYLVPLHSYRASRIEDMKDMLLEAKKEQSGNIYTFLSVKEGFIQALLEKKENEMVFVAGSLYLVGEVLSYLKENYDKF